MTVAPRAPAAAELDRSAAEGARVIDVVAWEVLNATADDWESVDQLHAAVVRFLAPEVSRAAVAGVAERLAAAGLFERRPAAAPMEAAWFRMTVAGRAAWAEAADRYARQAEPGAAPDPAGT